MKYAIVTAIALFIAYISILIFTESLNKNQGLKKNAKYAAIVMSISIPFISIIGALIFLLGKLVVTTLPITISNYQLFIISIIGIFIIFLGDFLTKKLTLTFSSYLLDKNYDYEKLREEQVKEIIEKAGRNSESLSILLLYGISFLAYLVVVKILSINSNFLFLSLFSMINILVYSLIFKRKTRKNLSKS
ncbi:MAG: hypothetical protein ACRDD2_00540 [Sarcina sp.]